uniref:28S ribosomal protein S26, mitochondrial-like n=1 Tax=Styela clava TaxID=7725 RepID=UPI001939D976|nr:28S ribosomal protein S26, mitochondrial-like [Styela clava]
MALVRSNILSRVFYKPSMLETKLHLPLLEQVRYRKPKWLLPRRAPSKAGIYFNKPRPTEHDVKKSELIYKSYNEMLRSIAAAFQEEILINEAKKESKTVSKNSFDEQSHHEKCMAYNEAYNKEMREKREQKLDRILENQEQQLSQKVSLLEKKFEHKLAKYEQEVLTAIDESENWITEENLEEKIEEALDNVVNFNFAVKRNGRIALRTVIP